MEIASRRDDDPDQHCYVAEVGPTMDVNLNYPNIGPRVSIYDTKGQLLSRVGDLHGGEEAWQFLAPHSAQNCSSPDELDSALPYIPEPKTAPVGTVCQHLGAGRNV